MRRREGTDSIIDYDFIQKGHKMAERKMWLDPREVNKEFGFSTSTLAKWRMDNLNLKFYKIGKYIRYKRSEIEAFIESNEVEVAS